MPQQPCSPGAPPGLIHSFTPDLGTVIFLSGLSGNTSPNDINWQAVSILIDITLFQSRRISERRQGLWANEEEVDERGGWEEAQA